MPTYDYQCQACKKKWEERRPIAERNVPAEQPCPDCGKPEVQMLIGMPGIVDPVRIGARKPDKAFQELYNEMRRKTPGNTLPDKY